jgi:cytochrome c-type biogenesis protein CcmE
VNTTLKFGLVIAVVVGTLGWLASSGVNEDSASYYKTIKEIEKLDASARTKKLRVGGDIEKGSIKREGKQVQFVLVEETRKMTVRYDGNEPLPDTFRDGAQALVDGRIEPNGVFHAAKISAKCASKYEAKPGQNYQKQNSINQRPA